MCSRVAHALSTVAAVVILDVLDMPFLRDGVLLLIPQGMQQDSNLLLQLWYDYLIFI